MATYRFSSSTGNTHNFGSVTGSTFSFSGILGGFDPSQLEDVVGRYVADEDNIEYGGSVLNGTSDAWKDTSPVQSSVGFVFAGWIKVTDTSPATPEIIFDQADEATSGQDEYKLQITSGGNLEAVVFHGGSTATATTSNSFSAGWNHVIFQTTTTFGRVVATLNGDAGNQGSDIGISAPTGLDNILLGAHEDSFGVSNYFGGTLGRCDFWSVDSLLTSTQIQNLSRGDEPSSVLGLGAPDHTWFDQSSDGTDSAGTVDLSSIGSPTSSNECYVLRDLENTRHLLATSNGPDWSNDANSTGRKGLVFDRANQEFMKVDSAPVTAAPFTGWCWASANDLTNDLCVWSLVDSSVGNQWLGTFFEGSVAGDPVSHQGQSGATPSRPRTTTSYSLDTIHLITSLEIASNDRTVKIDGGSADNDTTNIAPSGIDRIAIGYLSDLSPSDYHNGTFHELVLISGVATAQEESDMRTYGASTWGAYDGQPEQLPDLVARYTADEPYVEHSGSILASGSSEGWTIGDPIITNYSFVLSIWFKLGTASKTTLAGVADDSVEDVYWRFGIDASQQAFFDSRNAGAVQSAVTTNSMSNNNWGHVVFFGVSATNRISVLNGDWANRGTNTTNDTPASVDKFGLGVLPRLSDIYFDGTIARADLWVGEDGTDNTTRQAVAEALARGDDPASTSIGQATHTWFDQSTDGTDSGAIGGKNLTSSGTPVAVAECYVLRDRTGNNRHMLATSAGPDWSDNANGVGHGGLVHVPSEWLQFSGTQAITSAPFTVWGWFSSNQNLGNDIFWFLGSGSSNEFWRLQFQGGDAGDPIRFSVNDGVVNAQPDTTSGFSVDTIHLITAIEAASNDRTLRLDGGSSTNNTDGVTPATPDLMAIGDTRDSTPGPALDGTFHELIIIDDSATTEEEADVESYGTTQWGAP